MLQMVAIPAHIIGTIKGQNGFISLVSTDKDKDKGLGFDRVLTGARNGVYSWAVVLYNGSSASLHCQDAGHLQDDVLRRSPA